MVRFAKKYKSAGRSPQRDHILDYQAPQNGGVWDDSVGEEDDKEDKDRGGNKVVEAEEGRVLWGFQEGVGRGCGASS